MGVVETLISQGSKLAYTRSKLLEGEPEIFGHPIGWSMVPWVGFRLEKSWRVENGGGGEFLEVVALLVHIVGKLIEVPSEILEDVEEVWLAPSERYSEASSRRG